MPSCSVPPSGTSSAACRPAAYSVRSTGSRGGANNGKSVAGEVEHEIECIRRDVGIAGHERHVRIGLRHHQQVQRAIASKLQQIDGQIGVRAGAETGLRAALAFGDQLGKDIDPAVEHVAQRMGVVCRDVALLRRGRVQAAAGEKEELVDLDIWRQSPGALRHAIRELRIACKQPLRHRRHEPAFQVLPGMRLLQGQRGENAQLDRRIGNRARVERIRHVIGLADAERQPENNILADPRDDGFGKTLRIGECDGLCHASCDQPGSGRKRSPYLLASSSRAASTLPTPRARA